MIWLNFNMCRSCYSRALERLLSRSAYLKLRGAGEYLGFRVAKPHRDVSCRLSEAYTYLLRTGPNYPPFRVCTPGDRHCLEGLRVL